ncbi:MAG: hypothetical protein COZ37_02890 [bacterium (Candidatus Ratteibacteria) CG_4_10_14_3_um_filter_41_18]|uniref:Uncharacterized protein n=4 Tax=Candidatus Ratteibacteria TaxID=2979319 RepID=A0A2M7YGA7_9BACT|nr:MAG: hypothetical protein AUJ76_04050 [Candidatus Omnitrophica bacterium CG1_02_41_171]PIV63465.1 MAG: hypothetical protein COS11_07295 [bacterium (Candidatus Ratteibacteria) CG01_land_8_20_14_3_00_40_19]PIW34093.1 MAG: hypothetical protein COW28_01115 [bacterium (Candidatus Ratteibacteria) CG15_BIG_FIL_POST_REV_8_21_14_020_41_12]PIW73975.1 MAG: hypothetical protein CO004_03130 [bacterium (Candidatus Ratteibacteria) CG_4_8_14_3_um_filter_41_36]PIX77398.1 MAG: hypothetical protein COZ37_02890
MEIVALVLGFLALLLTGYWSKKTNDLVSSEDRIAKNLIEEGGKRTQEMIEEGKKETQRIIEEGQKRTEQLTHYIASLIAADGNKTRELIKER